MASPLNNQWQAIRSNKEPLVSGYCSSRKGAKKRARKGVAGVEESAAGLEESAAEVKESATTSTEDDDPTQAPFFTKVWGPLFLSQDKLAKLQAGIRDKEDDYAITPEIPVNLSDYFPEDKRRELRFSAKNMCFMKSHWNEAKTVAHLKYLVKNMSKILEEKEAKTKSEEEIDRAGLLNIKATGRVIRESADTFVRICNEGDEHIHPETCKVKRRFNCMGDRGERGRGHDDVEDPAEGPARKKQRTAPRGS